MIVTSLAFLNIILGAGSIFNRVFMKYQLSNTTKGLSSNLDISTESYIAFFTAIV